MRQEKKKGRRSPGTHMPPRHDFPAAQSAATSAREMDPIVRLQNEAARLLLAPLAPTKESSTSRVLEHFPNSLPSSSRALEVLLSTNLLRHSHTLFRSHWPLVRLPQFFGHPWITSEILLARDQDYRKARAEVHNLRDPLLLNVVQRVRGVNGETDQDNMGVGVTERAETIVILLSSRIPQGELNVLSIYFDIGHIVLKHSGYINLRESSFREDDQQASLSTSTITDNDQLPADFGHNVLIRRGGISFVCSQKDVSEEKLRVDGVGEGE